MFPLNYGQIYTIPNDYQPPADGYGGTKYPNLNCIEYSKTLLNRTVRMHRAWECLDLNEYEELIIATNKLSGREWKATLWGFHKQQIDDIDNDEQLNPNSAKFKLQLNALAHQLRYVTTNLFLVALNTGTLELWSTKSEKRNTTKDDYCLFRISDKCEHIGPILCLDIIKNDHYKAITGCKNKTIKLWDMGYADLCSIQSYHAAHTDAITSVASAHTNDSIFGSCSLDKSALLWDVRLARPAVALYEPHVEQFKYLTWAMPLNSEIDTVGDAARTTTTTTPTTITANTTNTTTTEHLLYVGDVAGYVHTIDARVVNKFLESHKYFDRSIKKIIPNAVGQKLAIIADSNIIKITTNTLNDNEIIYENADSMNFIRDSLWCTDNELWSVGFDGKLRKHKIN